MRLCALVWLAGLMASAQVAEIRGVLLEKATEQPIKGSVHVSLLGGGRDSGATLETNASGEFTVRLGPGTYSVNFEGNDQYRPAHLQVELAAGDRSKSLRLLVERVGRVTGRVIDDATGEPVKDAPVVMMQVYWLNGRLQEDETPVKTDAEGRFQGSGDRDEAWVAAIKPRMVAPTSDAEHVITKFSEADLAATDEDWEESYWPGGARVLTEALPAPYIADQTTDIGNIRVRKVKYRRALVHFPVQDGCFEGQVYEGKFIEPFDELRTFTLRCGRDQLLRGLLPGIRYRIEIMQQDRGGPDTWRKGVLDFAIDERNPELRVVLTRGTDLDGRLVFAEGSSLPKTPLVLVLKEENGPPQERRLDKEGRFKFDNVLLGTQSFYVYGEDKRFYAQHVRMNGIEVPGGLSEHKFEWSGQGLLEVVVDDQPGVVAGIAKDSSGHVARARVVVVPWPMPAGTGVFGMRTYGDADPEGRYRVDALPPGEYRVVAATWESRLKLEEPGVLERLLPSAEKVTLGRGSAVTLDVRVVELK